MERERIAQRRQQDYERFRAFERERVMTDEITNASERLALPMRNRFDYQLGEDGELWFQGQSLGEIFNRGVMVAEEIASRQPQFITELIRRVIERDEYDAQRALACGSEGDPDVLVVISPIPDAVVEGVELDAYDRERMKTLVRVYERTADGVAATSLSLDRSDRAGLQAVASRFGYEIPDGASSEEILQMRLWVERSGLNEEPVEAALRAYDDTLSQLYGGQWFAGRQDSPVFEAMEFIERQPDLISEHLADLALVRQQYAGEQLRRQLEQARYNFAAALARRLRGDSDAGTLSEAGDIARANGERYQNDCPEGMSTTQALGELGIGNAEMKCVTCPFCGQTVDAIVGGGSISCPSCETSVDRRTGKVTRATDHAELPPMSLKRTHGRRSARQALLQQYGPHAEVRRMTVIGGTKRVVVDRRTGEVLSTQ